MPGLNGVVSEVLRMNLSNRILITENTEVSENEVCMVFSVFFAFSAVKK